jgi:hypothetical protein
VRDKPRVTVSGKVWIGLGYVGHITGGSRDRRQAPLCRTEKKRAKYGARDRFDGPRQRPPDLAPYRPRIHSDRPVLTPPPFLVLRFWVRTAVVELSCEEIHRELAARIGALLSAAG